VEVKVKIPAKAVVDLVSRVLVRGPAQARAQDLILVLTLVQMMALTGIPTGPRVRVRLVLELGSVLAMIGQEMAIGPQMMIEEVAGY